MEIEYKNIIDIWENSQETSMIHYNIKDTVEDSIVNEITFTSITIEDIEEYYFSEYAANKQIENIMLNVSFTTIFFSDQLMDIAANIISTYCLPRLGELRYVSYLAISEVTEFMVLNLDPYLWNYDVFKNVELLEILLSVDFIKWCNIIIDIFSKYLNCLDNITNDEICLYLINKLQE